MWHTIIMIMGATIFLVRLTDHADCRLQTDRVAVDLNRPWKLGVNHPTIGISQKGH
jgi:hypothetical protein